MERLPDRVGPDHFHALIVGTFGGKGLAGLTGQIRLEKTPEKGRIGDMISGSEKNHRRRPHRLGDVGRPRIVGKSPAGQSEEPLEGSPGKLGPKMDPGRERPAGGGEGFLLRPVGRPSETQDMEVLVV